MAEVFNELAGAAGLPVQRQTDLDDRIALVEASIQVNGEDVGRAACRGGTLKQAGLQVMAIVIGEEWATKEAQETAMAKSVEWKVLTV